MSPRLLFLLSSNHPLTRERDRIDAERAAARLRPRAGSPRSTSPARRTRRPVSLSRRSLNRQRESAGSVTRSGTEDHLSLMRARRG
jgi:hypothetical protein